MTWTIETKLLSLVGVAGHLYLEIFNDAGERVMQVNGFAADPKTLRPRSVGLPGDFLKAYVSNIDILEESAGGVRDHHPHPGRVLFEGSKEDVLKAIKAAQEAAVKINSLGLRYHLFTQNSNSVFMYIVEAISNVLPLNLSSLQEVVDMKLMLPGINKQIDGKGGYPSLKKRFNDAGAKNQKKPARKLPRPKP
jgi:hypothetical protein